MAQNPGPVEVKLACAQKGTGQLQRVGKASDCPSSRGKLVRFPQDFPVIACVANKSPRQLFRVSDASRCKAPKHPNTTAVRLPASNDLKLCIATSGALRVVATYSACNASERRGVLKKLPNRKPVVRTSAGALAYTEGQAAKAIDPGLTVSDVNDTHFEGASVRIAAGFQSGDGLVFVNRAGITGTYNSGTGVLTLRGHATKVAYRDALRSVRFRTLSDPPGAARSIAFRVNDGNVASDPATRRINVTGVNDAPVVATTSGLTYFTEGDPAVAIDPGLTVTDTDSAQMSSAIVQIGAGFVAADDRLLFTNQLGITGSYDPVAGRLTLTGIASKASYQTALRSVRYRNVGEDPGANRLIAFNVRDSAPPQPESNAAVRGVRVFGENDPPTLTTSSGSTTYDISDGAPVAIDAALTTADVDDANFEGAAVAISAGLEAGDVVSFTDQLGITGSYSSSTGILTLTGTASTSDYQAALRSVAFNTTNVSPSSSRTVAFAVYDGDTASPQGSKGISLVP